MRSGTMDHEKGLVKNARSMVWALMVLGCLVVAAPARGQTTLFTVNGDSFFDRFGHSVTWAGDGFDDLIVGALFDDIPGSKMEAAPVIDGVVSEEEWASAATVKRDLVLMATGSASGETGQYWIGYDKKYIYIASRITLQNPEGVRADEYRENVSLGGDDSFSFTLDPFGKGRNQNRFSFNANGATRTFIAGGRANKREWGGRFESAGRVTETGWEGEARIAWEIMSLPSAGVRDLRFRVAWYVPSTQQSLSDIVNLGDPSQMHTLTGVEIPASSRKSPIRLLPYAYGGIGENSGHIANAGLDLKTSFAEKATLVATFSPDFRNIENAILNLDFSNFERLAGETRPFFLEGRQYLPVGNQFASQRIGTFDTGVKLYGNLDDRTRFGVLSTVNFGTDHTFVGSISHSPDLNTSFFGAIVTLDREGEDNVASELAASKRFGDYVFGGSFQHTDDEVTGSGESILFVARKTAPGLFLSGSYRAVSPTYNPRLGFSPRTDFRGPSVVGGLTQYYSEGQITSTTVRVFAQDYDTYSGGHFQESLRTNIFVLFKSGLSVNASSLFDHFLDRHDRLYRVSVSTRSDPYRSWSISHARGNLVGERYSSTSLSVRYRPVKRLQLSLSYQAVEHTVDRDQTIFNFNWEMGKYQSVGGRAVQQGDRWNWFASYRMSGNVGTEYFLIVGDPNASSFQKTLILKVSVPLTIGG